MYVLLNEMEMLQSIGNSVIFDIGCLVSAVRQDQGIRVAHCDAVSGELQHKKIVRAVAECIGVFDRNPKAVCQKPDSGCFAEIFLSQFPGLVFMYETQKMFICLQICGKFPYQNQQTEKPEICQM